MKHLRVLTICFLFSYNLFSIAKDKHVQAPEAGTSGEYTGPVFPWPSDKSDASKESHLARFGKVSSQVNFYANAAGTFKNQEGEWRERLIAERLRRVQKVHSKKSLRSFCNAVKSELVNKKYPDGRQYGNCGEGAYVAACTALQHDFSESEILICKADSGSKEHQFTLVPDKESSESYCLLDRLNKGHCGVTAVGRRNDVTIGGFRASNFSGLGKIHPDSIFANVKCSNFINYVLDPNL